MQTTARYATKASKEKKASKAKPTRPLWKGFSAVKDSKQQRQPGKSERDFNRKNTQCAFVILHSVGKHLSKKIKFKESKFNYLERGLYITTLENEIHKVVTNNMRGIQREGGGQIGNRKYVSTSYPVRKMEAISQNEQKRKKN